MFLMAATGFAQVDTTKKDTIRRPPIGLALQKDTTHRAKNQPNKKNQVKPSKKDSVKGKNSY